MPPRKQRASDGSPVRYFICITSSLAREFSAIEYGPTAVPLSAHLHAFVESIGSQWALTMPVPAAARRSRQRLRRPIDVGVNFVNKNGEPNSHGACRLTDCLGRLWLSGELQCSDDSTLLQRPNWWIIRHRIVKMSTRKTRCDSRPSSNSVD